MASIRSTPRDDPWTSIPDIVNSSRCDSRFAAADACSCRPAATPDSSPQYALGLYAEFWDPSNGVIMISADQEKVFSGLPPSAHSRWWDI
ncbi:hypothetical protein PsYK624_059510 [Phanerochaete sordida]|uniref:Uncharacterized protein n=1 Tax=Phanerochaete sordida TaxID=48140 RepID=A0A9P3G7Q2_9APHY|nr:hypothetical protein PsYK624_059510 [Phanerochaete sordida]